MEVSNETLEVTNENMNLQWKSGVQTEIWKSPTKIWGFKWKSGVSNENFWVSNENMGSPLKIWGSPTRIWASPTKIWGLQWKYVGLKWESRRLQRKYWVSNENMWDSNEKLGVSFETSMEDSNERGSPIVLQWWCFLPRLTAESNVNLD